MERSSLVPSTSTAYLFLMVALLFGLPLLTAYYNVDSSFYFSLLIPYLVTTIGIAALLIFLSSYGNRGTLGSLTSSSFPDPYGKGPPKTSFIATFNSISSYLIMGLFTVMIILLVWMRNLISSYYPYPPPQFTDYIGGGYVVLLIVVSVLGISRLVYLSFPIVRKILQLRKYAWMSLVMCLGFAFVYLALVNQILIDGFNTFGNVAPPSNTYPFATVFTVGIQQPFLNLVYLPYVIVQFSQQVNLLIVPFEVVFTIVLSILVASNVVMAHYLISNSGLSCSTKGTALSTGGSILGLTATCPTCLVPTFVSVMFGGVVAAEAAYSNIYGVILPPVVSLATLVVSILYLSRMIKKRTNIDG